MTDNPKPAMTMRQIREGLGHKVPPPGIPEPTVKAVEYTVNGYTVADALAMQKKRAERDG